MRVLLWVSLAVGLWFRLSGWKAGRDAAWNACIEAKTSRIEGWLGRRGELRDPRIDGRPFGGRVRLMEPGFRLESLVSGTWLSVRGRAECRAAARNPAAVLDQGLIPRGPDLLVRRAVLERAKPTWRSWLQSKLGAVLQAAHSQRPGLHALARAVWLADDEGFPAFFREIYREGGLLHLLALSGQHVACLSSLVLALARFSGLMRWRFVVPLFCALLLYATSLQAPSMARTLGMAIAAALLYWRRLGASPLQLTASSVACLLVWDPGWLGQPGFFLSAVGTLALVGAVRGGYARVAVAMAVFTLPLSAFYFGRVSLVSAFSNLALAFFWNGWLVVGFLAPVLPFSFLETLWQEFVAGHAFFDAPVHAAWIPVPRPSWPELVVIEWLAAIAFYRYAVSNEEKRCPPRKRNANDKIAFATRSRASTISSRPTSEST